MSKDEELARFQADLLDLLDKAQPGDDIRCELRRLPSAAPFADYVAQIEPKMLAVGALLVKKWGARTKSL
jgi:hypothetical protein